MYNTYLNDLVCFNNLFMETKIIVYNKYINLNKIYTVNSQ